MLPKGEERGGSLKLYVVDRYTVELSTLLYVTLPKV